MFLYYCTAGFPATAETLASRYASNSREDNNSKEANNTSTGSFKGPEKV
jgi:hypothetical protein